MKKFLSHIVSALLGLWLATIFVPGVWIRLYSDSNFFGIHLNAPWQIFLILGIALGVLNVFIKPILDAITLPLRLITLGLFGLVIQMVLIWILDYIFREFNSPLLFPILWTSVMIFVLNIVASNVLSKEE